MRDPVYGKIVLDSIAAQIIETRHFQRLKEIRQLGFVYKIHPNGGHRRYEHCIGTYHLAGVFLDKLEQNSEVEIDEFHKQCVKLAGLLHDIAHGPFSHFWEHFFNKNYKHEEESASCIDKIFEEIEVEDENMRERGVKLIKSLIKGNEDPSKDFPDVPEYLFEIINNKRNKIDVDKWDYIQRDHHYCTGLLENLKDLNIDYEVNETLKNLFLGAKLSTDKKHIDFGSQDKIYKLFEIRLIFHRHIYRLPKIEVLNIIVQKSLDLAHKNGKLFSGRDLLTLNPADQEFFELVDDEIIKFLNDIKDIPELQRYMRCYENVELEIIDEAHKNGDDECVSFDIGGKCYVYYFRILSN